MDGDRIGSQFRRCEKSASSTSSSGVKLFSISSGCQTSSLFHHGDRFSHDQQRMMSVFNQGLCVPLLQTGSRSLHHQFLKDSYGIAQGWNSAAGDSRMPCLKYAAQPTCIPISAPNTVFLPTQPSTSGTGAPLSIKHRKVDTSFTSGDSKGRFKENSLANQPLLTQTLMQPLTITGPSRLPDGISKNSEKCPYSTNDAAEYLLAKAAISKINRGLDSLPPLQPLHFAPHWGNPINVCSGEKRDATITSVPSSTITNPTFKSSSSRTKLMAVQGHNGQIKPYSYFSSSPSRMLMIRRLYGMSHNVRNIGITELWQRHLYDDGDCCICGFSACDYFKKAHYFTGNFGEPHCSKFTADADDCCAYYSAIRDAENQAPTDKTSNRQAMMKIQMKLLMLRQLPKSYSHYDAAHCEVSHPLQRDPVPHQQHMIPMTGFPTQHFQCWSSPMIEHQIPMNPGFSRLEPSETFRCGSTKPPGGRSFPTTRFFNAQDNGDYERFTWENVSSAQMHEILRHQHHEECSDPGIPASTTFMPPFAENFRYFDPRSADLFDVSFSSIIPEDYRTEHFAFFHPYDSMHDYLQQQEQNENDIAFSAEMKN